MTILNKYDKFSDQYAQASDLTWIKLNATPSNSYEDASGKFIVGTNNAGDIMLHHTGSIAPLLTVHYGAGVKVAVSAIDTVINEWNPDN